MLSRSRKISLKRRSVECQAQETWLNMFIWSQVKVAHNYSSKLTALFLRRRNNEKEEEEDKRDHNEEKARRSECRRDFSWYLIFILLRIFHDRGGNRCHIQFLLIQSFFSKNRFEINAFRSCESGCIIRR